MAMFTAFAKQIEKRLEYIWQYCTNHKDQIYTRGPSVKNEGPSEKIAFSNFLEPGFKILFETKWSKEF